MVTQLGDPRNIAISEQTDLERTVGDWQGGRFAWKLSNVRPIPTPIPASGKQGLWNPYGSMLAELVSQMGFI